MNPKSNKNVTRPKNMSFFFLLPTINFSNFIITQKGTFSFSFFFSLFDTNKLCWKKKQERRVKFEFDLAQGNEEFFFIFFHLISSFFDVVIIIKFCFHIIISFSFIFNSNSTHTWTKMKMKMLQTQVVVHAYSRSKIHKKYLKKIKKILKLDFLL